MCKGKTIIITLTAKFLRSYHTAASCTLLENYQYNLEHLMKGKRLFDLLCGVYSKHCISMNFCTEFSKAQVFPCEYR